MCLWFWLLRWAYPEIIFSFFSRLLIIHIVSSCNTLKTIFSLNVLHIVYILYLIIWSFPYRQCMWFWFCYFTHAILFPCALCNFFGVYMSSYYLKLYLWQYFELMFELCSSREYLCLLLLSFWVYNQLKTTLKDWLRSFAWSSQTVWILVPRLYENHLLGNISEGRHFQLFRGLKWKCILVFHLLVGHFFLELIQNAAFRVSQL